MPIYLLKCLSCGKQQDKILGLSELDGKDTKKMDLHDIGVSCDSCGEQVFEKLVTAHGKTGHNWSGWQRNEK